MKNFKISPYLIAVVGVLVVFTIIGAIAAGAAGGLIGFSVVGLIALTGYLIQISVRESEKNRNLD